MLRNQRFPHARRNRPSHAQFALIGAGLALAAVLVIPSLGTGGGVLDLQGQGAAPNVIAQGPTPVTPTPVTLTPPPASAAPSPSDPATTPNPRIGTSARPAVIGEGVPPSRLASEITGTKAPSIDILTGYRWPVAKVRLTLAFGPTPWGSRLVDGETFHDGIDLATFCGDRVTAAHDGVVLAAGRRYDAYMGWVGDLEPYLRRLDRLSAWMTLPIVVVTDDGNGYRSMYAHFGKVVVKQGQVVKAGQLLGYEGATGRASGCHVHYGLFSPWETATFLIKPDVAKRMKLPKAEIARIDPLLVMPPKAGVNAPKNARPSPSPSPSPSPKP
ncbi:MAG TPA: M23 family metallopeptidase [Candidatus Limnocylindrales bacterium]|nr:M23 family metallopeptidase [Candidatus Limnocylindrales bacterium]